MRVTVIVLALMSALGILFSCGLAQADPEIIPSLAPSPTPTPTPAAMTDFVFTYRSPSGCTDISTCDYFVSVSGDISDDTLDFYLEAEAEGWVAIGFSDSANMFLADCMGCVRAGDAVMAVDTWNRNSGRDNVLDTTQNGITQYLAEYEDGRIFCNFSRSVSGDDINRDLDLLARSYFHLYGTGLDPQQGSVPVPFNYHGSGNTPTISNGVVDLTAPVAPPTEIISPAPAPTNDPIDYTIIARSPSSCQPSSCDIFLGIQVNQDNSSFLDIYLEGNAQGWLAVGFTPTSNMFDADVVGCNRVGSSSEVIAADTYNLPATRFNALDSDQNGITQHSGTFMNGRISCSFSRIAAGVPDQVPQQDFDLTAQTYFVLYGYGDTVSSTSSSAASFSQHQVNPFISADRIALNSLVDSTDSVDTVAPTGSSGGQVIQAHGHLMIITVSVIAVSAVLFAA